MKRNQFLRISSFIPFISVSRGLGSIDTKTMSVEKNIAPKPEENPNTFFYKPVGAWAADFIPLYAEGEFQLFFLLDWRDRDKHGEGTPWYRISTKDFVHFTEHGEMLPRGTKEEQDLYVFTGSAIHAKGQYHIFYTGHNPYMGEKGKPEQGVMHAVSDDMQHWKKIPEHTFFAPTDRFEKNDWRDAFVFWNDQAQEYNMLLAARFKEGIPRRRGLTAVCASKDLEKWEVKQPFYAPNLYYTHECPDLFKMGDWWYLLFSEFTDLVRTRYRMSRHLNGPWITPEKDDFDGHAFYAAKTASDGKKRFLFGWNPTRDEAKDNGGWNWGGNLVVHEILQEKDGTLSVRVPETVDAAFNKPESLAFKAGTSTFKTIDHGVQLEAVGSFAAAVAGKMPPTCKIETNIIVEHGTKACGLMIRASDDLEKAYYLRLEPMRQRVVFDMWPRDRSEVSQMVELERPVAMLPGKPIHLQVFMDGNMGVLYVNNKVAMNFRAYDLREGNLCVFVSEGKATFKETSMKMI